MANNQLETAKLHDVLLSQMPLKASHDAALCPYCEASGSGSETRDETITPQGGDIPVDEKTYTKTELDAAVAEAIKPLADELVVIKESADLANVDARFAEHTAAHEAAIAELQSELDKAVADSASKQTELDELAAFLAEEVAKTEAESTYLARCEAVRELVAEHAPFDDSYIEENLERWVSMEADAFNAALEDWKTIKSAKTESKDEGDESTDEKPTSTAMKASTETADDTQSNVGDIRRELHRVDAQSIRTLSR